MLLTLAMSPGYTAIAFTNDRATICSLPLREGLSLVLGAEDFRAFPIHLFGREQLLMSFVDMTAAASLALKSPRRDFGVLTKSEEHLGLQSLEAVVSAVQIGRLTNSGTPGKLIQWSFWLHKDPCDLSQGTRTTDSVGIRLASLVVVFAHDTSRRRSCVLSFYGFPHWCLCCLVSPVAALRKTRQSWGLLRRRHSL